VRPRPDQLRDYREYPVLYVDDEPENLRIFELTFRRDFAITTAESGEEGLEILSCQPIAVVLSDHRMPGMMGTEFLARVAELDPKTVRIMVTAYGDAETLENAINAGSIYRYIPKPWRPDDVRTRSTASASSCCAS
jgi:response regulator RpfG family c-di-GMP phosphodiesterase